MCSYSQEQKVFLFRAVDLKFLCGAARVPTLARVYNAITVAM
jgi:hypothetical protein